MATLVALLIARTLKVDSAVGSPLAGNAGMARRRRSAGAPRPLGAGERATGAENLSLQGVVLISLLCGDRCCRLAGSASGCRHRAADDTDAGARRRDACIPPHSACGLAVKASRSP